MPELRDQLTTIYVIELIAAALSAGIYSISLWAFWTCKTKTSERKRKILGASLLTAALVFCWALFALIEVRRFDETVTKAVFQGIAYIRWIYIAGAAGALAFGLSKFYQLHDTPTWVFVICTVLGFANLSAATFTSVNNESQRWEFFGVSAAFVAVALIVQLLADRIEGWSTPVKEGDNDDMFARGFVRLWVTVFWVGFWVIWFFGPFGLALGDANSPVFEQAFYLALVVLGLLITAALVLFLLSSSSGVLRSNSMYQRVRDATTAPSCPATRDQTILNAASGRRV
jgi:hypothetical protein